MKKESRTLIGVPADVRDKLRIVAAFQRRSLAAEATAALAQHVDAFFAKHPSLSPDLGHQAPSAP